jgi:hypothetical protein
MRRLDRPHHDLPHAANRKHTSAQYLQMQAGKIFGMVADCKKKCWGAMGGFY